MAQQSSSPRAEAPNSRRQPPEIVYKIVNPLIKAILHSPLHSLLSKMLMTITFSGRKTSRSYTIPVGYQQEGDRLIVYSHHHWWKNLDGGAPVTVRLRGKERRGWAEPVTDRKEVLRRVRTFIKQNGVENVRRLGMTLESKNPGDEELRRAAEGTVVIRINLKAGQQVRR